MSNQYFSTHQRVGAFCQPGFVRPSHHFVRPSRQHVAKIVANVAKIVGSGGVQGIDFVRKRL